MSDTVLAIVELERFPKEVTARAAWLAKLYGCDLHLLLSDPTVGILRHRLVISNEAKAIARTSRRHRKASWTSWRPAPPTAAILP